MFDSILIANRGEIACRIMRTARRMGIGTVAVYSEADADAAHVEMADTAVCLGPPAAAESYLAIDKVVDAARRTGAQAIHPGYGFLSENANFAEACSAAGIAFIGPAAETIRRMGSKVEAKRVAEEAGVPVVPGYHGTDQSPSQLIEAADLIGFPLLIKASAGGGGRGMRLVTEGEGFAEALASARREAKAAFGDDRILLEYYIARSRHVEIQIFGDSTGEIVHLFERDCSVQRRYQKILEEAPSPALDPGVLAAMAEAAVEIARAVDYVGAGTVEFIVDLGGGDGSNGYYFLEMNTRLQVEHPVTEMVTDVDLVEWQILVAGGAPVPLPQSAVSRRGHAIEARLYAEDPQRDFLPSVGKLAHLHFPDGDAALRVDAGVRAGDSVSSHYDPMIAKFVAWGADRDEALRVMRRALDATEVAGVATNRDLLAAILVSPDFAAGDFDTAFLDARGEDLLVDMRPPVSGSLVLAGLAELDRLAAAAAPGGAAGDPYSPWRRRDAWRMFGGGATSLVFRIDGEAVAVTAAAVGAGYRFDLPEGEVRVDNVKIGGALVRAAIDGRRTVGRVVRVGPEYHVIVSGAVRRLMLEDPDGSAAAVEAGAGKLTAPLPGTVVRVHAEAGQKVSRGEALMVLEAMKMEHVVAAPDDGVVAAIHYASGDQVSEGDELIAFESR